MAQQGGIGEVIGIALVGGAAWVAWNLYNGWLAQQQQAYVSPAVPATPVTTPVATAPTTTTAPPATTVAQVSQLSIPSGFTVAGDINNSLKGTITWNGAPLTINIIPANAGQSTGVAFNTNGQDITSLFTSGQLSQLVSAFNAAAAAQGVTPGLSGFGGAGVMGLGRNYVHSSTPMLRAAKNYVLRRDF